MDQNQIAQQPAAAAAPGRADEPISKSSMIMGAVAACIAWMPIGSIVAIILGIIAMKKARRGREAVEASGGTLRGKGNHIAGKIMGICAIAFGALMTVYYLVVIFAMIAAVGSRHHYPGY